MDILQWESSDNSGQLVQPQYVAEWMQQSPGSYNINNLIQQKYELEGRLQDATQFIQRLMNEREILQKNFRYDSQTSIWWCEMSHGKSYAMCSFWVNSVLVINPHSNNTFDALKVNFVTGSFSGSAVIPFKDYTKKHLLPYFKEIEIFHACNEKDLNSLLFERIKMADKNEVITLPKRAGWFKTSIVNNYTGLPIYYFIHSSFYDPYLGMYLSDAIKKRTLFPSKRSFEAIRKDLIEIFPKSWKFSFVWGVHVASLLLTIFSEFRIEPKQMLVLLTTDNEMTDLLTAIVKTKSYNSFSALSLNSSKKEIQQELDETNDGVALFKDTFSFDDETEAYDALKCIRNDLLHATGDEEVSKHITVILSSWANSQLSSEEAFVIPFYDVDISENIDIPQIQHLIGEFDFCLIDFITNNFNQVKLALGNAIKSADELIYENSSKNLLSNQKWLYIMICTMYNIIPLYFRMSFFKPDEFQKCIEFILHNQESEDRTLLITEDFVNVVEDLVCNEKLQIIDKKHSETIENRENIVIAMDNSLAFSSEVIEQLVLPAMKTTNQKKILIKALDECGYLYTTARKKQPINRRDAQGRTFRFRPYGIDRNIFSDKVKQKIDSLSMGEFFCDKDEIPKGYFLPLIHSNKRAAGKMIQPLSSRNNIIYVTGISEMGKSYTLAQIVAFLSELNHRIIIFDNSNSFSDEALDNNLPADFVEDCITIHDLKEDGIPVNLFEIDDNMPAIDNADEIAKILFSSIDAPVQLEKFTLHLSEVISNEGFKENPAAVLLDSFQFKRRQFLERFGTVLTKMKDYGVLKQNWKEFMDKSKKIIIIRNRVLFGDKYSNPIFNMLLEKFYNFQMNHPEISVDIVIDELNSQNTGINSPIRSIVTNCRKAHTAFVGATQEYRKKSTINETMSQAKTRIFLKPSPTSEDDVAAELRYGKKKRAYFDGMDVGDAIVKGDFYSTERERNCPEILCGKICTYEEWLPFIKKSEDDTNN